MNNNVLRLAALCSIQKSTHHCLTLTLLPNLFRCQFLFSFYFGCCSALSDFQWILPFDCFAQSCSDHYSVRILDNPRFPVQHLSHIGRSFAMGILHCSQKFPEIAGTPAIWLFHCPLNLSEATLFIATWLFIRVQGINVVPVIGFSPFPKSFRLQWNSCSLTVASLCFCHSVITFHPDAVMGLSFACSYIGHSLTKFRQFKLCCLQEQVHPDPDIFVTILRSGVPSRQINIYVAIMPCWHQSLSMLNSCLVLLLFFCYKSCLQTLIDCKLGADFRTC